MDDNLLKGPHYWEIVKDGNIDARKLADRHYSRKTKGALLFCGPGQHLVLLSKNKKALFVWRKNKYRRDNQEGVECTIFRNESEILSSELIKESLIIAKNKWKNERFFTYVNPKKILSTYPGYCFIKAGWKVVGKNKNKKLILLKFYESNQI